MGHSGNSDAWTHPINGDLLLNTSMTIKMTSFPVPSQTHGNTCCWIKRNWGTQTLTVVDVNTYFLLAALHKPNHQPAQRPRALQSCAGSQALSAAKLQQTNRFNRHGSVVIYEVKNNQPISDELPGEGGQTYQSWWRKIRGWPRLVSSTIPESSRCWLAGAFTCHGAVKEWAGLMFE